MEIRQALRIRIPSLGLALCVALLGGCLGPTPHIRFQLTGEWDTWRSGNNKTRFLPAGETMEDWTEAIELEKIYRPIVGASSPGEWLDAYGENLRENRPGDTITMIRETPLGILFGGDEQHAGEPNTKLCKYPLPSAVLGWCLPRQHPWIPCAVSLGQGAGQR